MTPRNTTRSFCRKRGERAWGSIKTGLTCQKTSANLPTPKVIAWEVTSDLKTVLDRAFKGEL